MSEQLKIFGKLHAIYKELAYVQKDGKNSYHGYKYLSDSGLKTALHPLLEKHGVLFLPTVLSVEDIREVATKAGKVEMVTKVTVSYCYVDVESGESVVGDSVGYGVDGADKGVYKAYTGAVKYAHLQTFQIPSGDDPEADSTLEKDSAEATQEKVRDEKVAVAKKANEAREAKHKLEPREAFKALMEKLVQVEPTKGEAVRWINKVLGANGFESAEPLFAAPRDKQTEIYKEIQTVEKPWKEKALELQHADA